LIAASNKQTKKHAGLVTWQ